MEKVLLAGVFVALAAGILRADIVTIKIVESQTEYKNDHNGHQGALILCDKFDNAQENTCSDKNISDLVIWGTENILFYSDNNDKEPGGVPAADTGIPIFTECFELPCDYLLERHYPTVWEPGRLDPGGSSDTNTTLKYEIYSDVPDEPDSLTMLITALGILGVVLKFGRWGHQPR